MESKNLNEQLKELEEILYKNETLKEVRYVLEFAWWNKKWYNKGV